MRSAALLAVAVLLVASLPAVPLARAETLAIVTVGDPAELRSRNALVVLLGTSPDDVSPGILEPVFSRLVLLSLTEREPLPYLAKGVDADGDGRFDVSEHGVFRKDAGTIATDIDAYVDLNGVRWHDGTQVTPMDVLFSFVLASLSPRQNATLRALWDDPNDPASFWTSRHLNMDLLYCSPTESQWQGASALPGNPALRCALRFRLAYPYPPFVAAVLGGVRLFPRGVWEGTGGARHADFGRAIYPETDPRAGQGIPLSETSYKPFDYRAAEAWLPSDADVIGSGPFRFSAFSAGQYTRLTRNPAYYVGVDPISATVYDDRLTAFVHGPFVDGIDFLPFRTVQLAVIALQNGMIDYLRRDLPREWVPDLFNDFPRFRIYANASLDFTYLAYNMRRGALGYNRTDGGDAADSGRPFRLASARAFDKRTLVSTILQNYGVPSDSVVSPANLLWHNESLPAPGYDLNAARSILDNAGWIDSDGDGWREIPTVGDSLLSILVPTADYDPFPTAAGVMWAAGMRAVGLNVTATPTAFGSVQDALETYTFDLAVGSLSDPGPDPDYLYTYFDCANRRGGPNFAGYCDPEFDRVIELARAEMDPAERQRLVRWAQGIIMDDRPVEPLFSTTLLQATFRRYVNWSSEFGNLWNFWSWIGVRAPLVGGTLRLSMATPSAMSRGAQATITVHLRDLARGTGVADARVVLRILTTGGGLFLPTSSAQVTGSTDAQGAFSVVYEAPIAMDSYPMDVAIEASASRDDYPSPAQTAALITVYPTGVEFLSLLISLPGGDITTPDAPLPIRIVVVDSAGEPAPDAVVRATAWPSNATLSRRNGTAAEMATITFAPPFGLAAELSWGIDITAEKAGYAPARRNVSILVVAPGGPGTNPPTGTVSDDLLLAGGIAVVLLGVAAVALALLKRRSRRRRGAS